jgi:ABC-type transport system involved in multi-copper enzyme maturation permease subunit
MRQLFTIAKNAYMELVRQPIFLLLMTFSSAFCIFIANVFYFALGDDPTMTKSSVLAVMFVTGLFAAVISASASVAHEIRSGTALAVLSKPVGRAGFLIGKYLGLAGALATLAYVNALCALLASRMAFDAYGEPDKIAMGIFYGLLLFAYILGGFTNYFLRRPFVADAVFFVVIFISIAFVVINFINKDGQLQAFAKGVDWRMVQASTLILFALWILAGIALACSTRWEMIPTLAICTAVFLLGLMSDYLFGKPAQAGSWWAQLMYTVTPNWQLFWVADALDKDHRIAIPWTYLGTALTYLVSYLGAALAVGLILFEDRELA